MIHLCGVYVCVGVKVKLNELLRQDESPEVRQAGSVSVRTLA